MEPVLVVARSPGRHVCINCWVKRLVSAAECLLPDAGYRLDLRPCGTLRFRDAAKSNGRFLGFQLGYDRGFRGTDSRLHRIV